MPLLDVLAEIRDGPLPGTVDLLITSDVVDIASLPMVPCSALASSLLVVDFVLKDDTVFPAGSWMALELCLPDGFGFFPSLFWEE